MRLILKFTITVVSNYSLSGMSSLENLLQRRNRLCARIKRLDQKIAQREENMRVVASDMAECTGISKDACASVLNRAR